MNILPDTNAWIAWLRRRHMPEAALEAPRPRVLLATVVLQELWSGAPDAQQARDLNRLFDVARRAGTLVNPPAAAWILSGRALASLASTRRLGAQRLRSLRHDCLIAVSASLLGATVWTEDLRDFELLADVVPVNVERPGDNGAGADGPTA